MKGDTLLQRVVIAGKSVTFDIIDVFWGTDLASDGIYGFSGSAVETYASNNSIPFHVLTEVTYDSRGGSVVPYDYVISLGDTVDAPAPTRHVCRLCLRRLVSDGGLRHRSGHISVYGELRHHAVCEVDAGLYPHV